ncbi:hypothetical protein [Conexibacter sp. SYSU D00693]|uniref:hypothetical protein n=1 Tax=Conexibacter sp. SYSU D00693 TaxID=2812560 RepID=UPI00196B0556|nr:hypothetical protein [Conexibacter sp. SYSU D00693]
MSEQSGHALPGPDNEATIRVRDERLLGPVLGRVVGMLAARANFPVDRLDDALLVTDAIAAHGPENAGDDDLGVTVTTEDGALRLRVGPLRDGGPSAMLQAAVLPSVGNVFERLADDVTADDEHLVIHVAAR